MSLDDYWVLKGSDGYIHWESIILWPLGGWKIGGRGGDFDWMI